MLSPTAEENRFVGFALSIKIEMKVDDKDDSDDDVVAKILLEEKFIEIDESDDDEELEQLMMRV